MASGCAALSMHTRPVPTASCEPDALAAHYGPRGLRRARDHGSLEADGSGYRRAVCSCSPSVELNCILPAARDGHVLGFGISADADLAALGAEYADLEWTAGFIAEHGGVAYLAHPYWTGATSGTSSLPENVAGIEVWNAGCSSRWGGSCPRFTGTSCSRPAARSFGLVTDDSHHPGFDSGYGWTWLRVPERTADAVLAGLAAGSFYGQPWSVAARRRGRRRGRRGSLQPARSVTLVSGRTEGAAVNAGRLGYRYAGEVLAADDRGITHARLRRPFGAAYARLELTDATGNRAWTNPL